MSLSEQQGDVLRRESRLRTLPEQIAERLYESIVSERVQPGERLREDALATSFNVSRGPIREALRILENDGVIQMLPNRGAYVSKLSVEEVNSVFEVRILLAGAMIRGLANASKAVLSDFEKRVQKLEGLANEPGEQADTYAACSVDLSLTLAESCGNPVLAQFMGSLARRSWRYTKLSLRTVERRQSSATNWRQIYNYVKKGEVQEAGEIMQRLVNATRLDAVKYLSEVGPS
ncbi:GntR family transcriptional regulator [Ottowia thiooxydans]|uniref:GntR family transcriptional regulator n=1 Tax=Ottowia thiooxydans TaxID=219182 RepID=UPI000410D30A|nr:GntR family transcriptional regulator [Ottowia thiooxydans]